MGIQLLHICCLESQLPRLVSLGDNAYELRKMEILQT